MAETLPLNESGAITILITTTALLFYFKTSLFEHFDRRQESPVSQSCHRRQKPPPTHRSTAVYLILLAFERQTMSQVLNFAER
jgi:uncharacterized membrane protein